MAMPLVRDTALARKITLILVLKICFLYLLWKVSFSDPQSDGMNLPPPVVQDRLLGPAASSG